MLSHDHRSLGRQLDLYHIEEEAPGMVFWHPRGFRIYRVLEDFIRVRMRRLGYEEVRTPQLMPRALWERSGHWEKFRDNMFVVPREEGRDLALKPMSCPCHVQIFNSGLRSWRDLPMRFAEFGLCHRDEASGSMHGLMRTRAFEQDDAHVLCMAHQVEAEVARFVGLLREIYEALGFPRFEVALSLRPEKRAGDDAVWDAAEAQLLAAARTQGLEPVMQPGEGAFYGPKLEFALRDSNGRSWQCGTVQLDMVLPGRLGAAYIDESGAKAVPIMIHHAVLGSLGRFIGILLEEREGQLPGWLAPEQVAILPVSDKQLGEARDLEMLLRGEDLRPVCLSGGETLGRRALEVRDRKIPIQVVIGAREAAAGRVMLKQGGKEISLGIEDAVAQIKAACRCP